MAGWNEWVSGANMTLSEVLDALKSATIGLDVKDKLFWSYYKIVELAIKEGNANFDVAKAAGAFKDLASRLDASDQKVDSNTAQLEQKLTDGSAIITMDHLTQGVKTAMTGGSVAVVGEGAVGMVNLTTELQTIFNDFEALMTDQDELWEVI